MFRRRYRRIIGFFARIVAGFVYWELFLPRLGMRARVERTRPERLAQTAVRFRDLAVEMGGVMIKLGQFLSSRLDVLPPEIIDPLSTLQDAVPEVPFEQIRELLEAELDASIEDRFEQFDPVPMAAASLGQVHKARLCTPAGPGDRLWAAASCAVIVKVQRPNIEQIVAVDLAALRAVSRWIKHYPPIRKRADVEALLGEFSRVTFQEIDYLAEGRNAETFATNFKDHPGVRIPRVHWPLTTRRVLTLEDVEGIKITDYAAIETAGIDRVEVSQRLFDVYMQQIFEHGFFHADPHPGNLFVELAEGEGDGDETEDQGASGRPWTLTFVDFGMVGRVPDQVQAGLREAFIGVATYDARRLVGSFQALNMLLPNTDLDLLTKIAARMLEETRGRSLSDMHGMSPQEAEALLYEIREVIYDMPFQMPEDFIFLGRTASILSGMCGGLDPDFDPTASLQPYAQKLMAGDGAAQAVWDEIKRVGTALLRLPGRVDSLLAQLEGGELGVRTPGVEQRIDRLERRLSRFTWALALIAVSLSGTQLLLGGREVVGWGLLGLAGALLVWLLVAR